MVSRTHLGVSAWRAPVDEAAGLAVTFCDFVFSNKAAALVAHQDEHEDAENKRNEANNL